MWHIFQNFRRLEADEMNFIMYWRFFFVFAYHVIPILSLPATTYDQRQTGEVNIQVHVKDVQVMTLLNTELLDDYTEYDYFYDYADFTVKPTVKPAITSTNTTTEVSPLFTTTVNQVNSSSFITSDPENVNSTIKSKKVQTPEIVEPENGTSNISSVENMENSHSGVDVMVLKKRINDKTTLFKDDESHVMKEHTLRWETGNQSKGLSKKLCKSGYSPNGKGRCRRQSQSRLALIPLAIRLVPKLLNGLSSSKKNLE